MPGRSVGSRIDALLARFELTERAGDRVAKYSKGMKQRLEVEVAHDHADLVGDLPHAAESIIAEVFGGGRVRLR